MSIPTELLFSLHGLLGAFLATLLWAKSYKDLYSFDAVRNHVIGLIVGYVYSLLHSQYNFPNAVMSIVAGYFGKDFVEAVIERLKSFKR
jgi:uncharacterized membrane protein YeaQ/YmgE (transglycosylase-associated protein family)